MSVARQRLHEEYLWRQRCRVAREEINDLFDDVLGLVQSLADGMRVEDMAQVVRLAKVTVGEYLDDEVRG